MLLRRVESEYKNQTGCDEAGRGCLAGPVVAAAVLFPVDYTNAEIDDSKKLSPKKRESLIVDIKSNSLDSGIGICDHEEIDRMNILNASILAMHRALDLLGAEQNLLLIDGNKFKNYKNIPHQCIIKGDSKYLQIAAASILAKTYRDKLMMDYHENYPEYNFVRNKGYASREHIEAIERYGYSPIHRKTFKLKKQIKHLYLFD